MTEGASDYNKIKIKRIVGQSVGEVKKFVIIARSCTAPPRRRPPRLCPSSWVS